MNSSNAPAPESSTAAHSTSSSAPAAPAAPAPVSLSSDLIQQYLDENQLMLATIIEHQNAGKLEAAVKYQQKLQQNLMYLATLADQSRSK